MTDYKRESGSILGRLTREVVRIPGSPGDGSTLLGRIVIELGVFWREGEGGCFMGF